MMGDREEAIQAALTAISGFRNYYRDPENGPFCGSEADWLWAEAERATDAVLAALSTVAPAYSPADFTAQISCSHSLLTCPHCARAFFLEAQLRPAPSEGGEDR